MKTRVFLAGLLAGTLGFMCVQPSPKLPPKPPAAGPISYEWLHFLGPKTDCESMAITNSNWQRCPEKL